MKNEVQDMEQITELLPNWGMGGLVVVVVFAFLKYMKDNSKQLSDISNKCHETQIEMQEGYERSISRLISAHEKQTDRLSNGIAKAETRVVEHLKNIRSEVHK